MSVASQTIGPVGEPVQIVSPPYPAFNDVPEPKLEQEVQECVCLVGNSRCSLRPATCCCCFLCQVHCSRIPLILFMVFLGFVGISHYSPIVRFIYRLHSLLGGFCFFVAAFVYAPLAACCTIHQHYIIPRQEAGQESRCMQRPSSRCDSLTAYLGRCNRFTIISHSLVFVFALLILLPVLLMAPLAADLNDGALENTFGAGRLSSPMPVSLDFGQWLFQGLFTNGPYGPPTEEKRRTFVYKLGLPTSPPQDECYRAWAPHLELDVHFPEACMKTNSCTNNTPLAPIIFHIHCGGWEVGDKSEVCGGWSNMAYFLERGYAVVSPQYRFACHGYNATDMLSDVRDAYNFVQADAAKLHLDKTSVHLMGGSAGGHLALLLGYALTDGSASDGADYLGIKSITELYGITDIANLGTCTADSKDKTMRTVTGDCNSEGMRLASPVNYITHSSPPTLIFHGTIDTLVPHGQAVILKDKLDAVGVPNYLMSIESWDHVPENGYYGVPAQIFRYAFERFLAARI